MKRILAYSSVSHAGFMLIAIAAANPLGARALIFYLIPYSAMSLGAFAVVAARERELGVPVTLQNLAGFGWERPFLGVSMWVFMLGMLGFPLTGGFIGKFYVFAAAYDSGLWWLIVAGVIATMISAYYYLGIVRAMYFRDAAELQLAPAGGSPPRELLLGVGVADLRRGHGRLVLRRPAADRRRALRGGRAAVLNLVSRSSRLTEVYGFAGRSDRRRRCGAAREHELEREDDEAGDERRRAERRQRLRLGGRRARGTREHEEREREAPEERLEAAERARAVLEVLAEADQRRDRRERDRRQQRVEREAVGAAGVGHRRDDREESRKCSTSHEHLASPSGRTVLLCSCRPQSPAKRNVTMATFTWLGHASFRLDTDGGKRIYVDPWLSGPTCPESEREPERADVIAVTHGHGDHVGDVIGLQQKLGCKVIGHGRADGVARGERRRRRTQLVAFNKGGTVEIDGVRFTLTNAFHSSSAPDGTYAGEPAGFVIRADGNVGLLRRRHVRLRRHAADRAPLPPAGRGAADRRPLHDGAGGGRARAGAARQPALRARATGARSRCSPARPTRSPQLTRSQVERIEPGDTVEL